MTRVPLRQGPTLHFPSQDSSRSVAHCPNNDTLLSDEEDLDFSSFQDSQNSPLPATWGAVALLG